MNNLRSGSIKRILLRAADAGKVALIYLLTFSMLLFAGIYINMRQNSSIKTNMPTEKLRSLEHLKYEFPIQNEIFCLLPVEYVVSNKGNANCCFNNNEIMQTALDRNKNIIAPLCKNNAVYEKKSSEEGKVIWEEAFGFDYFIYIKFANEFPPKIIYDAFSTRFKLDSDGNGNESAEDTAVSSGNETTDVYIYELIIIPQKPENENISGAGNISAERSYYALARDKNANVTLIYPPEEASKLYDSKDIIAYNTIEGFISCEFMRNQEEFNSYADSLGIKLPGEAVIFKEDTFADIINTKDSLTFNADGSIDTTPSYIWNLFYFLDFNLEKTIPHLSNGASSHIMPSNGTLKFYTDGLIHYTAQSEAEGVKLEKFLGYRSEPYSSSDKLAAAFNFAGIFREDFIGSKVSLQLTEVSFEEESGAVVYTFSYYLNNILIYGKNKTTDALTIKIKNDTVIEIKFYSMLFCAVEDGNIKNINQFLSLKEILDAYPSAGKAPDHGYKNVIDSFTLNYFCVERDEIMFPNWTAVGKN